MSFNIEVESGTSVRLPTAGKYCDRDIIVTAKGGGGVSVEGIPEGYTKADFIRFTDAQIIDTGVICNQNTQIHVLFSREDSTAMYLYGVVNDGNTASVTAYLSSGGSWRFGNKSTSRTLSVNANIIHNAIVSKSGIVHETGTATLSGISDFETIGTLLIGTCRAASGAVQSAQYIGKVFLFEMWDGEAQILKLIPVTDGERYRFWDAIGQKFHDSITDVPLDGGYL